MIKKNGGAIAYSNEVIIIGQEQKVVLFEMNPLQKMLRRVSSVQIDCTTYSDGMRKAFRSLGNLKHIRVTGDRSEAVVREIRHDFPGIGVEHQYSGVIFTSSPDGPFPYNIIELTGE